MVRAGDQKEGKITAVDASRLLIEYTYDRVVGKTLPKNNRWLMSKTIWDEASNARSKLLRANSIRVENYKEAVERLLLLKEAIGHLDALIADIDTLHINEIHLELNDKTTLFPLKQGIVFLQWHFYYTSTGGVRMKMSNKKQGTERRRLKKLYEKELKGEVPDGATRNSLTAWIANAKRGNSYHRIGRMIEYENRLRRTNEDGNSSGKTDQS